MSSFNDFVKGMVKNWDSNDAQAEIGRFKYALVRDMKETRNSEWHDALEALHGNIEDRNFWMQVSVLMNIELPE